MTIRKDIIKLLTEQKELSISDIKKETGYNADRISKTLNALSKEGMVKRSGRFKWIPLFDESITEHLDNPLVPKNVIYYDYANVVSKLMKCYEEKVFPLLIGPKGVGKTAAVSKVAERVGKPMRSVNFSLRTREHHFVGRIDTRPDNTFYFKKGPLIKSMEEGGILYLDEINVAVSGVLIRLDEALDFRRKVSVENRTYKAKEGWWCVGTINPLDRYHAGTKEMPGQLVSRFPARIYLDYPDASVEYKIVKMHVPKITKVSNFMDMLFSIRGLRQTDIPYIPSIRESIALARLLVAGVNKSTALEMAIVDVYQQWGNDTTTSVREYLYGRLSSKIDIRWEQDSYAQK